MSDTGSYPNRSDLRDAATRQVRFTGQTYGEGASQARAQRAVPPGAPPAVVQGQQAGAQARPSVRGALMRPTERPDEPVTAGAPFGPGPTGPQMGINPKILPDDTLTDRMLALYELFPSDRLRMLIMRMMSKR